MLPLLPVAISLTFLLTQWNLDDGTVGLRPKLSLAVQKQDDEFINNSTQEDNGGHTAHFIADLATALSFPVAALAFIFTVSDKFQRDRRKELQNWQRVVVYKIIENGKTTFDEIKASYLLTVQQFQGSKIPRKEIQDDALQLALLSLQEAGLIARVDDGRYLHVRTSSERAQFEALAVEMMRLRAIEPKLIAEIFETLERENGRNTTFDLFRRLKAEGLGMTFEHFDFLVRMQVNQGSIVLGKDGKLSLRLRTQN